MAARRQVKPVSPFREEQEQWDRELWKAIGLAIGKWLTDGQLDLRRPLASLTLNELTGMGWAAISTYQNMRQQRERALRDRPDPLLAGANSAKLG